MNVHAKSRREILLGRAAEMKWFHAIDFGDCQSSGRFPAGTPQNRTLFGVMDLLNAVDVAGRECIDISTAHGLISFNLAARGAEVTATDIHPTVSPPFALARDLLGLKVDYLPDTNFGNIVEKCGAHRFDVAICAGVFYHMLNPFESMIEARRLLRPGGLLVYESAYDPALSGAVMDFNPSSGRLKEVYTYWVPAGALIADMLRFAGFDVLASRTIANPDRVAFIARNVAIDAVCNRPAMMATIHETGVPDPDFVADLPTGDDTDIEYAGPRDDRAIDWKTYKPDFFPHPAAAKPILGTTVWRSRDRNF